MSVIWGSREVELYKEELPTFTAIHPDSLPPHVAATDHVTNLPHILLSDYCCRLEKSMIVCGIN